MDDKEIVEKINHHINEFNRLLTVAMNHEIQVDIESLDITSTGDEPVRHFYLQVNCFKYLG